MATSSHDRGALRLREAALYLGVSQRTLWQWARDGEIPHVRAGNGKRCILLFPVSMLDEWLRQQAAGTAPATQEQ